MPTSSEPALTPLVRLVLMLCRYPSDRVDTAEVARLCAEIGDGNQPAWEHFLKLARHHRVMPLISKNSGTVILPAPVVDSLHAYAGKNAIEAFRALSETQRISSLLGAATIETAVLKGVPLSLQAYGDVATRDVGDIDLLLQCTMDANQVDRVLELHGFVRREPAGKLTRRRRDVYARHFKDYTYEPPSMAALGGFELDLHWRLFRSPLMPGNELAESETISVSAGSMQMKTLPPVVHMVYLSIQGALDGWTRLKAVADVAALWNAVDKPAALELARETATLPYLYAALSLANGWIGGLDLPEEFRLDSHPLTRIIVERARRIMYDSDFLPALRDTSSWSMKRYEASLCSDREYKRGILRRVFFRPRVWARFDLPDALFPLYPLLSPVEWMLFHLGSRKKPS